MFDTDVQARFLLSPDGDFSTKGSHTGISYIGSFNAYKDMIIENANTSHFKRIISELNELLFSTRRAVPRNTAIDDHGDYGDEVQEFLREDSTPPPDEEGAAADDVDEPPSSPAESSTNIDLEEPHPPHHAATSITLQDSHTVKVSSRAISITMFPPEPEAEVNPSVVQSNRSRPAPRKKATNTDGVGMSNATNATPAPATRGTRASTHQAATLPEQDSNPVARRSTKKRGKRS